MKYNIFVTLFSIIISSIIIIEPLKKYFITKGKIKEIIREYKTEFIAFFLLLIGNLIRLIAIDKWPIGLNVDEASAGYEAFSILNYGIDRNGNSFPVFLEAWGSGQNALYSYIMIPFIKIFGLNIIATRLPMALIGCLSLFVWYKLLDTICEDKKLKIIGLAFFVICPWHIMKSRWGLESNLFPDITLYAVFFITKFIRENNIKYFYVAFVLLGLTAYSYGTSYFFLPFFVLPLLIYLKLKKKISIYQIIIAITIVAAISLPVILYVIINTFNLNEIKLLGIFTVPKLPVNRYEQQTGIFSGNIIINLINNFKKSIKFLILQNDGLIWNNIPGFGITYIISLPFCIIGIIDCFKNRDVYKNIFNIWFIASVLLLFILNDANINRINILIIPIIYYTICGIYQCCNNRKIITRIFAIMYLIFFVCFSIKYVSLKNFGYTFVPDIEDVIHYVNDLDAENIYIEYSFKEPYIYVLYYTKYNTYDFINTKQYKNENVLGIFENIKSFGKYQFYIPDDLDEKKSAVYVLKKDNDYNIDITKYEVKEFKKYIVLQGKDKNE